MLGIAADTTLCGMRGYKAIAEWAKDLGPKARERFGYRSIAKRYIVPSESIIQDVLVRSLSILLLLCSGGMQPSVRKIKVSD
ncbi:MAG: hypothetical protein Q8K47_04290 [Nitrosomonas sp.]|nr:hypothetical protein [Nitrosomonas sp.]